MEGMQTAFDVISRAVMSAKGTGREYRSDDAATYHVGAIFIKHMPLKRTGDCIVQHSHTHPHVTLIASGAVLMSLDGAEDSVHTAPAFIEIKAGAHHAFTAIEDDTNAYCIHDLTGLDYQSDADLGTAFT
jgi:hypothetical protein